MTLIIETNRPSHSDTKKLNHFIKVTHYLLLSKLSIFQQKAERETIAVSYDLKDATLSPLFLFVKQYYEISKHPLTKSKPSVT